MELVTRQHIDIETYISFLNEILIKYHWREEDKQEISEGLSLLERKYSDKNLYLSIIGEFSSGKSTFINALLKDNLLEAANEQGTTVASTLIRYAPEYNVIIKKKDGNSSDYNEENERKFLSRPFFNKLFNRKRSEKNGYFPATPSRIVAFIKSATSDEMIAQQVKEIIIEHPSEFLKDGIVIIDTPGTNSIHGWHDEVTKAILSEISDMSVILTSASQIFPETLLSFIEENLNDILDRCVYILTKIDTIRERERVRVITTAAKTITRELGVSEPIILPYTALFVLSEEDESIKNELNYSGDDFKTLIEQSRQAEHEIRRQLKIQRENIQHQKLLKMMEHAFDNILTRMTELKENYRKDHDVLVKAEKRDLNDFASEMKQKYVGYFATHVQQASDNVVNSIVSLHSQKLEEIFFSFNNCQDIKQLNQFCNSTLPVMLNNVGEMLVAEGRRLCVFNYDEIVQLTLKHFWTDFEVVYKELAPLDIKPNGYKFENKYNSLSIYSLGQASDLATQFKKQMDNIQTAGAAVGAGLGMLFFPAIGPAMGAIFGSFLSGLFVNFEKKHAEFWEKVSPKIDEYFNNIFIYMENEMEDCAEKAKISIYNQISECVLVYGKLVDEMRTQDEKRKKQLDKDIMALESDLIKIKNYQQKTTETKQYLKEYSH